jgi:hypothetical protein
VAGYRPGFRHFHRQGSEDLDGRDSADLDGRIVGRLSSEIGNAGGAHEIAVIDAGDVYVGQLSGVAQKFVTR